MTFLNATLFGIGASLVAIPILIHLLMRRRRKPVEWAAMRFLIEALRRTRRRRLIEKWLLLAARCALVALIAIALGRPLMGAGSASAAAGRAVYILLDNSIASGAVGPDGKSAFARHQAAALKIIDALGPADRAGLILLGGPAEPIVVPASTGKSAVRDLIDRAPVTDSAADLPGALARIAAALTQASPDAPSESERLIVILSEFRAGSADVQQGLARLPAGVRIVAESPAETPLDNTAVTRITALRQIVLPREGGEAQTATVHLERSGRTDQPLTVGVRLQLVAADGRVLGAGAGGSGGVRARFGPGERQTSITIAVDLASSPGAGMVPGTAPVGPNSGGAMLVAQLDADALARDDLWRLPLETRETLRVGIVSDGSWRTTSAGGAETLRPAQWLGLSLRPTEASAIELFDIEPASIDTARLGGLDAAVIVAPQRLSDDSWKRLGAFARSGGLVVVFPSADSTVHGWTDAMTAGLGVSWSIARQASDWPDEPRPRLAGSLPPGTPADDDLLTAVRSELADLTRPVTLLRLLPIRSDTDAGRSLLSLEDGSPLIFAGRARAQASASPRPADDKPDEASVAPRGLVVFFAAALDPAWTDLPAKPLMVPLMQEIIRQGVGRARPAQWARAGAPVRTPPQSAELRSIAPADGPTLAVAESGETREPVRRAGAWTAIDSRAGVRGLIAVNPDARGSRLDTQDKPAISAWLGPAIEGGAAKLAWLDPRDAAAGSSAIGAALKVGQTGIPTGPALLALAALVALIETAIARWSSHARGETSPTHGGAAHA